MRMYRVILIALTFISTVSAAPQWLQYKTSERARDVLDASMAFHRPETEKPQIPLPELKGVRPVFIKWKTPMDPAGFRWAALDNSRKYGLCNVLYFDTNGNGRLDDDPKIEGIQTNDYEVEFGKVPVLFDSADGPITYHLNVRFYSYDNDSTYIYCYTGCWYEGQVEIDGNKQRCQLSDYNANGTFDDKSEDSWDHIKIGADKEVQDFYVGNYLEYKDKLYRLNIARDGAFIELTPAPDVAYGTVTMSKDITGFTASGLNGMFDRQVKDGQVSLPEGQYRIYKWQIKRKDSKGIEWALQASSPGKNNKFTIIKDKPVNLPKIGEPVFSKIRQFDREKQIYFDQSITGQSGEMISLTRAGKQSPAPKIHIRDKAGNYDRTFALEYG